MARPDNSRDDGAPEPFTHLVSASAHSHVGAVRRVNEDSFISRMPVFLVADGMGGHARGDRASQEVVRVFTEQLSNEHVSIERVLDAAQAANDAVRSLSNADDFGVAVAGTTLAGTVMVTSDTGAAAHWMVFNIGDSRVYSWDGRKLRQLSVDHSVVQELLDAGRITADQVDEHPERNVITRALGATAHANIDVWLVPVSGRQTFLVCSDGLSKELDDTVIGAILAGDGADSATEQSLAERLVAAAVRAGGRDNVTAVVIESLTENESGLPDDTRDRPGAEQLLEDTKPRG